MRAADAIILFADAEIMELAERVRSKSLAVAQTIDARSFIMQGALRAERIGEAELRTSVVDHLSELLVIFDETLTDLLVTIDELPAWLGSAA